MNCRSIGNLLAYSDYFVYIVHTDKKPKTPKPAPRVRAYCTRAKALQGRRDAKEATMAQFNCGNDEAGGMGNDAGKPRSLKTEVAKKCSPAPKSKP